MIKKRLYNTPKDYNIEKIVCFSSTIKPDTSCYQMYSELRKIFGELTGTYGYTVPGDYSGQFRIYAFFTDPQDELYVKFKTNLIYHDTQMWEVGLRFSCVEFTND